MLRESIKAIPGARAAYRWLRRHSFGRTGLLHDIDSAVGTAAFFDVVNRRRPSGNLAADLQTLKAINLLVNKHEYRTYAVRKLGRPSGFMLDTANACQLGCPSCQHTANREWARVTFKPMPAGSLKPEVYAAFIREVGLWSYNGHFYNNSEPFLNKRTPEYIRQANRYRIRTFVSSNLSIPKLDAEAIVASGLDVLMTAFDGATQATYERYRRGGNLQLALDNAAAIVAAKKRLRSRTPVMRWQFLTFEHNVHEIDKARGLARSIGYDIFNSATPYGVEADEPSIQVAERPEILDTFIAPAAAPWPQDLEPLRGEIAAAFEERLSAPLEQPSHPVPRCDWLQLAIVGDAVGRISPCCIPDFVDHGECTFGVMDHDVFNGPGHLQARARFAGREGTSKCDDCYRRPPPQVGLGAVAGYLDAEAKLPFDGGLQRRLVDWSEHSVSGLS